MTEPLAVVVGATGAPGRGHRAPPARSWRARARGGALGDALAVLGADDEGVVPCAADIGDDAAQEVIASAVAARGV